MQGAVSIVKQMIALVLLKSDIVTSPTASKSFVLAKASVNSPSNPWITLKDDGFWLTLIAAAKVLVAIIARRITKIIDFLIFTYSFNSIFIYFYKA